MNWYELCEFCPILDQERKKTLPFGNPEGRVLFIIPGYLRIDTDTQKEYTDKYPDAFFVAFTACGNVEDLRHAELMCSVLLRNVSRRFYKILISDYEPLKQLFGLQGDSVTHEDGTQICVYRGLPLEKSAESEYKRITHD